MILCFEDFPDAKVQVVICCRRRTADLMKGVLVVLVVIFHE
jgi:hypothetical protein